MFPSAPKACSGFGEVEKVLEEELVLDGMWELFHLLLNVLEALLPGKTTPLAVSS